VCEGGGGGDAGENVAAADITKKQIFAQKYQKIYIKLLKICNILSNFLIKLYKNFIYTKKTGD
jgi:hypothetical protein